MAPAPIKCKNTEPYTTRPLCGEFTWLVYNKTSGLIVAATYSEVMAKVIIDGIKRSPIYSEEYAIAEMYKG
jgi:hypothetical protein